MQEGLKNPSEHEMSNFQRRPLRVTGVISEEYSFDTSIVLLEDGTIQFQDSFAVELLRCLELTLNFTTVPIVSSTWGHILPNKSWTGMIALLLADQADLGLSSIADRPFRRDVVDFNLPTSEIRLSAFFERPSTISTEWNSLLKPFQPEFWATVFFTVFLMTATSLMFSRISFLHSPHSTPETFESYNQIPNFYFSSNSTKSCVPSQCKKEGQQRKKVEVDCRKKASGVVSEMSDSEEWQVGDSIHWAVSLFCLKGFHKVPSRIPFRILMLVGSVFGILIYSSYSGTLVSFLSVVIDPLQNVGQLLATRYTFSVVNNPIPKQFLSESPDPKSVQVYQRLKNSFPSMKEARENLVKGSFVFLTDNAGAYASLKEDFSSKEACRIKEIAIDNSRQRLGTLVQKNSPYKRVIDYQILKMIECGLVKRWNTKYLTGKPVCELLNEYEGVEFASLLLAFGLLVGGYLTGLVGLSVEKFVQLKQPLPASD